MATAQPQGEALVHWNQLDYFMRAYEAGSFLAAARTVPMSSQGFAKSIHALESELGVELFSVEKGGGLAPTPYAEEFRTFAQECLAAERRMRAGFAHIDGQRREVVHLAAAIGSLGLLGMEFVNAFCRENPQVEVVVDDLPDVKADAAVMDGSDCLGLVVLPAAEGLEVRGLCSCERCVWMRADDALAHRRTLAVADLADRSVAVVGPLFKGYGVLMEQLAAAGVEPAEVVTSSEMMWLHEFARDGHGLAFTAQSVLPAYAGDADVVAVPVEGMPYEIGVAWKAGAELTDGQRRFVEACEARAAAVRTGGEGARGQKGSLADRLRGLFG